ncbi:MAG: hypothetical protein RSA17_07985, partial [Ruthenibacterium sp.]
MADDKKTPVTKVDTAAFDVEKEIDIMVGKAKLALYEYLQMDQPTIDRIVHAMALAGLDKHQELARMAIDETGRGVYEDKV